MNAHALSGFIPPEESNLGTYDRFNTCNRFEFYVSITITTISSFVFLISMRSGPDVAIKNAQDISVRRQNHLLECLKTMATENLITVSCVLPTIFCMCSFYLHHL